MADRIKSLFEGLEKEKKKAFIPFVTAGDPDIRTTEEIVLGLEKAGADMIELGIPFSDPMADGPTIQASYERALKNHITIETVLSFLKKLRKKSSIPIVLFGYYNPVFSYGLKKFAKDAKAAGADGVLIVDLPPEESGELKRELDAKGLDLIFLLTPTSNDERIRLVAGKASGFIYFVSLTGVTGARSALSTKVHEYVKRVKKSTDLPIGIGFGISTPEQAREACRWGDGVIVGSAIINVIARNGGSRKIADEVGKFAGKLTRAIKQA